MTTLLQAGTVLLGRYELSTPIAAGGMGEVWQGRDQRLERVVAVKVLPAAQAHTVVSMQRLRLEAHNSARLRHPHVVTLLDYGEDGGAGVLVMEYVDGEALSAVLAREKTLPPEEVATILAQAARGLHAAHAAGVIHRDVKPSNLLITGAGFVKLTDFGISRHREQPELTAAGMVMGTAHYLAPELAAGGRPSPATDLYALGVVAFEMLTGHRPFDGASAVDVVMAHVHDPVPPLPAHVPAHLARTVTGLLAKDPTGRPRSGAALARSLEAATASVSPGVRSDSQQRSAAPPSRHPRRWRLPTVAELRADRVWWTAVLAGLAGVVILGTLLLGSLALATASRDVPDEPPGQVAQRLESNVKDNWW